QSVSITTPPAADIDVTQTQENYTEQGKQYIKYTITVKNNGPDNATGLQILDQLPNGLIYTKNLISTDGGITWTENTTSYNKNTGIWDIGNFNTNDQTKILIIIAEINTTGTIKNTATRTGTPAQYDWNPSNNAQTVTLNYTDIKCDIHVLQYPWYYLPSEGKYLEKYNVGGTPVFIVDVRNSALYDDATNIVIRYTIGDGFEYIGHTSEGVGRTERTGNIITWYIDYLPKGGQAFMTVYLMVTKSGDKTPSLTNNASLISVDQKDMTTKYNYQSC
ncbi:Domain of unknown function DUF11, partial [Syntrophomonas zehnderi OL-4]